MLQSTVDLLWMAGPACRHRPAAGRRCPLLPGKRHHLPRNAVQGPASRDANGARGPAAHRVSRKSRHHGSRHGPHVPGAGHRVPQRNVRGQPLEPLCQAVPGPAARAGNAVVTRTETSKVPVGKRQLVPVTTMVKVPVVQTRMLDEEITSRIAVAGPARPARAQRLCLRLHLRRRWPAECRRKRPPQSPTPGRSQAPRR